MVVVEERDSLVPAEDIPLEESERHSPDSWAGVVPPFCRTAKRWLTRLCTEVTGWKEGGSEGEWPGSGGLEGPSYRWSVPSELVNTVIVGPSSGSRGPGITVPAGVVSSPSDERVGRGGW